jgi:HPt (histidine-containing phosphotransfer) domain-containing protein
MVEWSDDPEMNQFRNEFIDSFPARQAALKKAARKNNADEIKIEAHKIAGAAGTYGLSILGEAAAAIETLIDATPDKLEIGKIATFAELLNEMLGQVVRSGEDPVELASDPRFKELISDTEDLASAAKSEFS